MIIMKKLENVENVETVNSIKNLWSFKNDYNLIFYYMDVNFLYIYSRITKKGSLYFFESEEEREIIKERIKNIKDNMEQSKISTINFYAIKKQSKAMHSNNCNNSEVEKGVFRKDTFFKGFFIRCYSKQEQRNFNEFYNVLPSGYIFKNTWGYNFYKYIKIKELVNVWNREDLLIMDNDKGEVIDKIEAIKRIKENSDIEIGYKGNGDLVAFSYWYWSDGDIFSVDDFVYCEDEDRLIDIDEAVWCDDIQDHRHIDDAFTDFHGNIFGSDDELIYSEEKSYYIYEKDAVKIYTDDINYFWAHCDDLEDYYYHEYDERYYTHYAYPNDSIIRAYQKTTLAPIDKGDKQYYVGIELEMENDLTDKEEREEDILAILDAEDGRYYYDNLIDWKEDSSLADGVEMVTAPISLDIFKDRIVPIIKRLQEKGYKSEKGGRCGNHIHISRAAFSEEAQARLILIYARFESLIKILSRRNENTEYCKDVLNTVSAISIDNANEVVKNQKEKRKNTAINFNNSNTIEFRTFRGTMNTDVLIANIQLVQLIADLALQELSVQNILDLTFNQLINKMFEADYKELIQYCDKKELL